MHKKVILVCAVLALISGYYFTNYSGNESALVEARDSFELDSTPKKAELQQENVPDKTLLGIQLTTLAGYQSSLSLINSELILVNFWATWCKPCIEEMPMLEALQRELGNAQFSIVGLAIDAADPARAMVEKLEITYPIFIADLDGPELMANNGNEQGLLPYTLLVDSGGQVLATKLGKVEEGDIRGWLEQELSTNDL